VRDRRFITYGQGRPIVRRAPCKGITVLFRKESDLIIAHDACSPSNLSVIMIANVKVPCAVDEMFSFLNANKLNRT